MNNFDQYVLCFNGSLSQFKSVDKIFYKSKRIVKRSCWYGISDMKIKLYFFGNMYKANILYQAMNLYLYEKGKRILESVCETDIYKIPMKTEF